MLLAPALVCGILLFLYGYAQERPGPLYLGLGLTFVGGLLGVIRIAVWGDS